MFPQALTLSTSWDEDLIYRVGRAIGTEARAIGIHACFAPVLDICRDSRWGRCQEDWGEDHILTSHLGVAFSSGLSKNGSWSDKDAVVPVIKHFAAHGSPQGGTNAAPWMGYGTREIMADLLMPFKAAIDLGGAGGVMMAYNELDDVPAPVSPILYDALEEWGFDGFVMADDTGMQWLEKFHKVAADATDAIGQWYNAGGMIEFYDYPLETYLNATMTLTQDGVVAIETLKKHIRRILGVKYDLGLFEDPYIADDIDPDAITDEHLDLTLEAAQKSIVLLKNEDSILPLSPTDEAINKIALIGPFADNSNYGDYSGQFGQYPWKHSSTIRKTILEKLKGANSTTKLSTAWGANTWLYNAQYPIKGYALRPVNGTHSGLSATYFADTNFSEPLVNTVEVPVMDWGLYPPPGLPSNNFSAIWEGTLTIPVDVTTEGWLGVAILYNSTAKLYVDGKLHIDVPLTTTGNILSNIPGRDYSLQNSTAPPPGSATFTFEPGAKHHIRLEFVSYNLYKKIANQASLNAEILLFWNLVDHSTPTSALEQAVSLASDADIILLAVGANWNSDGENGDRTTMGLSANQTALSSAIFELGKPVILILQGGRPFAIPEFYDKAAAVLSTGFGGQAAGQAISDVLFGDVNPGGRLTLTVPRSVGQMPVFYNQKKSAHLAEWLDEDITPAFPFGYGLSYSNFTVSNITADRMTFSASDFITFSVDITNTGPMNGSYVAQVYLLQRVSSISRPVKQLVAFKRVYLAVDETKTVEMEVEVERYLRILNR